MGFRSLYSPFSSVGIYTLAMGSGTTRTFASWFRVYRNALVFAPAHNPSFERRTRFRGGSLHITRFLCFAQQVHPLTNELAHIGKVLEKSTFVSENGSRTPFACALTFVFEPRRTELRSRNSISFSFIFLTASWSFISGIYRRFCGLAVVGWVGAWVGVVLR